MRALSLIRSLTHIHSLTLTHSDVFVVLWSDMAWQLRARSTRREYDAAFGKISCRSCVEAKGRYGIDE